MKIAHRRARWTRAGLVCRSIGLSCLAVAGVGLAGCGGASSPKTVASLNTPLNTAFVLGGESFAVLPMGRRSQPLTTFWQLFVRPARGGHWRLVTPPGVADNGGLVVGSLPGRSPRLEVGFRASADLGFSPLAVSAVGRIGWAAAGVLPGSFADYPDSLAVTTTGRLALVGTAGGEVLSIRGGTGAKWSPLLTEHALAVSPAGRACRVEALTAVALTLSGQFVGAACGEGVAGIFVHRGTRSKGWTLVRLPLPRGMGGGPTRVLRLVVDGDGLGAAALLAGGPAMSTLVVARTVTGLSGPWVASQPLVLGHGARLVSTSFGPATDVGVAWSTSAGGLRAAVGDAPGRGWEVLPSPPAGTADLFVGPGTVIDALAVTSTVLTDWRLVRSRLGGEGWSVVQRLRVPIDLGSSG